MQEAGRNWARQVSRTKSKLTIDEHFPFVAEYLLECLATDPNGVDDFLHEGWEAGHEQTDPVLREAHEPALLWGLEHSDKS